ncbi:glycosyltransferase family 2 protein [Pedobacter psychrodurus]|uniref:glycosyltransferase family 2 protein n=1 Tax=Pedobacter psychrodurus TaxID=2530456 RepID=UPI00292CB5E4|nr:glycosyltransferase family 2 protein [Pedobacter psychrodurus]
MRIFFIISILLVIYTYLGYGVLLYLMILAKRVFAPGIPKVFSYQELPSCTVIVAAFNEEDFIEEKISNTLALNYPAEKLKLIFVTDGSSDRTPEIVAGFTQIQLLHSPDRKGKIAAVHRAMDSVDTDLVVFTDANTFLNTDALFHLCKHYADERIGGVAGEKKVYVDKHADATAGEGIYWKYESKLKAWDSELYTVVGAAGELFSIRRSLYVPVPQQSVLDDFMISMRIAEKGYRISYEPKAFAQETSSANIEEELKRKVRIGAGGIQSVIWLRSLMNPFRYPMLAFQYISHRVLRWTLAPLALIAAYISNITIMATGGNNLYFVMFFLQSLFYLMAFSGLWMEKKKIRLKILFVPYYFCMMNYAIIAGAYRYFLGNQSVIWEKAIRK